MGKGRRSAIIARLWVGSAPMPTPLRIQPTVQELCATLETPSLILDQKWSQRHNTLPHICRFLLIRMGCGVSKSPHYSEDDIKNELLAKPNLRAGLKYVLLMALFFVLFLPKSPKAVERKSVAKVHRCRKRANSTSHLGGWCAPH